jgi:hypothetical protein
MMELNLHTSTFLCDVHNVILYDQLSGFRRKGKVKLLSKFKDKDSPLFK